MGEEYMLSDKEALRKLFVGGIPITTSDEEFTDYFRSYGEVSDSVIIKDSTTKKSRGFGFITFTSYTELNEVLKNRPHRFASKEVEVKRAIPRDNETVTGHIRCKKLFVGGLPKEANEEDLLVQLNEVYGHCELGVVTKVDFIKDKETGKNKGFGFIEVETEDLADLIIINDNKPTFCGKRIDIKKAEERGAKGGQRGGFSGRGRGRGGGHPAAAGGGGSGSYGRGYSGGSDSYGQGGFDGPQESYGGYGAPYGGGYSNGNYAAGQAYGDSGYGSYSAGTSYGGGYGGGPASGGNTGYDYNRGGGYSMMPTGYGRPANRFKPY